MEEYDWFYFLEVFLWLWFFFFFDMDYECVYVNEFFGDQRSIEQRYVDVVNGVLEIGFRKYLGDGGLFVVVFVVIDSLIDVGDFWGFNG